MTESSSKVLKRANPSTIQNKLLAGYQGWFTCTGDGPPVHRGHHGWLHWFNKPLTEGGRPNFDLFPDTSEYTSEELFAAPGLTYPSGSPVRLFSSRNPLTVQRHFHWMAQHGIDGVFLQRFAGQCEAYGRREGGNADIMRLRDEIGDRVKEAAEKEGRVFAIMYDVSGVPANEIEHIIRVDWLHLMSDKGVLNSPNYLRERGQPVIGLWGFGFNDAGHDPAMVKSLIHFLRIATPGGAYIWGGVPAHWRTLRGDQDPNPQFLDVYKNDFDALNPWTVGRYHDIHSADQFAEENIKEDIKELKTQGRGKKIDYFPTIWPGGSSFNLSEGRLAFNDSPHDGGKFLWRQIFNVKREGVRTVYMAMLDEYDEGTAILPSVTLTRNLPRERRFLALDEDGYDLTPDWFMRIAGFIGEGMRDERIIHEAFPKKELDDYWNTRPKYVDEMQSGAASSSADAAQVWEPVKEEKDEPPPPPYSLESEATEQTTGSVASTTPAAPSPVLAHTDARPYSIESVPQNVPVSDATALAAPSRLTDGQLRYSISVSGAPPASRLEHFQDANALRRAQSATGPAATGSNIGNLSNEFGRMALHSQQLSYTAPGNPVASAVLGVYDNSAPAAPASSAYSTPYAPGLSSPIHNTTDIRPQVTSYTPPRSPMLSQSSSTGSRPTSAMSHRPSSYIRLNESQHRASPLGQSPAAGVVALPPFPDHQDNTLTTGISYQTSPRVRVPQLPPIMNQDTSPGLSQSYYNSSATSSQQPDHSASEPSVLPQSYPNLNPASRQDDTSAPSTPFEEVPRAPYYPNAPLYGSATEAAPLNGTQQFGYPLQPTYPPAFAGGSSYSTPIQQPSAPWVPWSPPNRQNSDPQMPSYPSPQNSPYPPAPGGYQGPTYPPYGPPFPNTLPGFVPSTYGPPNAPFPSAVGPSYNYPAPNPPGGFPPPASYPPSGVSSYYVPPSTTYPPPAPYGGSSYSNQPYNYAPSHVGASYPQPGPGQSGGLSFPTAPSQVYATGRNVLDSLTQGGSSLLRKKYRK